MHFVANLHDISSGKAHIFDVQGVSIGIFNVDGNIHAIRNTCPHKQAPVCQGTVGGTMLPSDPCEFEFGLEGQVLKCPWHGWEFDITSGESLFGISSRKVQKYLIELKDDKIYIKV